MKSEACGQITADLSGHCGDSAIALNKIESYCRILSRKEHQLTHILAASFRLLCRKTPYMTLVERGKNLKATERTQLQDDGGLIQC